MLKIVIYKYVNYHIDFPWGSVIIRELMTLASYIRSAIEAVSLCQGRV